MSSDNIYVARERESYWYKQWTDQHLFHSEPDEREPYTIVIPPPNVTGVLHMGHTLNNTIQDILVRRARMQGYNACWVPGTDHASIATEAKVVAMLKEKNISKFDIGRDAFLEHAFEWKEKYGGIILQQLKKLGASCDWERTAFTMDDVRHQGVIDVFIRLFKKGLIYRGARMVNWDVIAKTAVSDEEVYYKESNDKLYYVKYRIAETEDYLTVATTRPETIMADSAICVNPNDERFSHLHGKKAIVPLVNREIPIIQDEYVDMEFGTGCLKITPAHDINDYNIGLKHNLEVIDIINDDGTLNEKAQFFIGEDREKARILAADMLQEKSLLSKTEDLVHNIGCSERSGAVIEPKISTQWFCKMADMAQPALDRVEKGDIEFHPSKFKNTYRHWLENIKDWCISRQLWWGHRIPAYYLPNGEIVVGKNDEEALAEAKKINPNYELDDLKQEEDVLDTWFSSWLWPLSVFNGIEEPNNEEIKYYYPTNTLVTGPDIIFFWVARMIMAGNEYRDEIPFKNVYFTGLVRDEQGRKMSKQLGNSPDLLKLVDHYGADSVRFGVLISSPAGNDLLFGEKLCEQGSQFINKLWNAYKLIESWKGFDKITDSAPIQIENKNAQAAALFQSRFYEAQQQIEKAYDKFKISEALQTIYRLCWSDFCSNYLEWVKPRKDTVIDKKAFDQTIAFFEDCLKLLHPFMPFISEELFHKIADRNDKQSICISAYPQPEKPSVKANWYYKADSFITDLRNYKVQQNLALKEQLSLAIKTKEKDFYQKNEEMLLNAASLKSVEIVDQEINGKNSFLSGTCQIYDLTSNNSLSQEDIEELKDELKRLERFKKGIEKKLSNERFVKNAPTQVVERERKKLADSEDKMKAIHSKLNE